MHEPILNFKPKAYPLGDITQFFGENPALYAQCCGMSGHNGLDIVRSHGTPIMCVETGKVVEVKDDSGGYGKHVKILSENNEWVYGHLSRIDVVLGQTVASGGQIGLLGNTGFVVSGATPYWKFNPYAGSHLHLGRRPCKKWESGSWNLSYSTGDRAILLSDYENGFKGSTDPLPEFVTQETPQFKFTKNLSFGMRDSEVTELQKYLGVIQTGYFGWLTFSAVLRWQYANKLPVTGYFGKMSRAIANVNN